MRKLNILILLTLCALCFGVRENIILDVKRDSWIADDDFKTIFELSFPFAQCINAYTSGQSQGIIVLFRQFIQVYKKDYKMGIPLSGCLGYLGIASSPERMMKQLKKIKPEMTAMTEMLYIIDDKLSENSSLLNAEFFELANVNIVSRSQMWTLSENYLFPRSFNKINKFQELEHKNGIVDLQGRELQVASFFNPPFCYLSTITIRTIKGIEAEVFIAEDSKELDGIEMHLFLIMAKKLNFTWTIRKPRGYFRYGSRDVAGLENSGGMIGQLIRGEIDLAFSGIWLKLDFNEVMSESKPWYQQSIHFLVPRPKPISSFWALTTPLSKRVWFVIAVMVLIQSINIYVHARIHPNVPTRFRNSILTFTELLGRFLGSYAPRDTTGLRVQLHLWHIGGILLVTAYCSSLASRLATPEYEPRIDEIKQFVEANLTWGRKPPEPVFEDYFNFEDQYARKIPNNYQNETSWEERHERIQKGNYAIVGRIVQGIFFAEGRVNEEDLGNYRLMKEETTKYYVSFATQPWLLRSIDEMVMWMQEGGLTKYYLTDVIYRRTISALREVLIEHDIRNENGAKVLVVEPLFLAFGILFFGLTLATIVFFFELRSKKRKKQTIRIRKRIGWSEKGANINMKRYPKRKKK